MFLAVHKPARFATVPSNLGVVLDYNGCSERRTLPEMMVGCVFGGLYPRSGHARHSRGRCPGVSQPVVIRALPSRRRRTLAVASLIDIVGQN